MGNFGSYCERVIAYKKAHFTFIKGTVMQIEKALINNRLRVSKVS